MLYRLKQPRHWQFSGPDVFWCIWNQRHEREQHFYFLSRLSTIHRQGWSTSHFHFRQTRWFQYPHRKLSVPELLYIFYRWPMAFLSHSWYDTSRTYWRLPLKYLMTFLNWTSSSDFPADQTLHWFMALIPNLIFTGSWSFHRAFATGVTFQQGTLTLPDASFRPFLVLAYNCWDHFPQLAVNFPTFTSNIPRYSLNFAYVLYVL